MEEEWCFEIKQTETCNKALDRSRTNRGKWFSPKYNMDKEFLKHQEYEVDENVYYQDNESAIKIEKTENNLWVNVRNI